MYAASALQSLSCQYTVSTCLWMSLHEILMKPMHATTLNSTLSTWLLVYSIHMYIFIGFSPVKNIVEMLFIKIKWVLTWSELMIWCTSLHEVLELCNDCYHLWKREIFESKMIMLPFSGGANHTYFKANVYVVMQSVFGVEYQFKIRNLILNFKSLSTL